MIQLVTLVINKMLTRIFCKKKLIESVSYSVCNKACYRKFMNW